MNNSLLTEAIKNMVAEDLIRAFENPKCNRTAKNLIRTELVKRLNRYDEAKQLFPNVA